MIFQFPIDHKIHHKWLEKCYPKDKFNKRTRSICTIYFSMASFIDYIKFPLWNLIINNLMLIHFHISLITKRFLRSCEHHSYKTVTLSELLSNINKFRNKILNFSESFTNVASKLFELLWYISWILLIPPVLLLQRIAALSPPSYILYTLYLPVIYTSLLRNYSRIIVI